MVSKAAETSKRQKHDNFFDTIYWTSRLTGIYVTGANASSFASKPKAKRRTL